MSLKTAIIETVKKIEGNLILIGIYDQLIFKTVDENDKITDCMIINNKKFSYGELNNGRGRVKHYNIKRLRKTFKKKTVNNIVANYDELKNKLHHFIKNSIYISKGNIYIYCNKEEDIDELVRRYNRYETTINIEEKEECKIVIIDASKAKNKKIKDIGYTISDIVFIATDFIGDLLTN